MTPLDDHPLACLFPLMAEADLAALAADIDANGLREPIWLYEGMILDGRNRYRACGLIDADHRVEHYRGADPLGFVVSRNLHRRHLTESQRAMVAADIANMRQGERTDVAEPSANLPKVSQAAAAAMVGVGERSVRDAVKVKAKAVPELAEAVKAGEVSVSAAAEVADLPPAEQKAAVKGGGKGVAAKAKERKTNKAGGKGKAVAKPANAPEPVSQPDPEPAGQGADEQAAAVAPVDEGAAFVAEVEAVCREADALAKRMRALKGSPLGYSIHVDSAVAQVEAARKTLWQGRPAHPCPYCEANETAGCRACNGTRRVKKSTLDAGREAVEGVR